MLEESEIKRDINKVEGPAIFAVDELYTRDEDEVVRSNFLSEKTL
jgi:hypothetical protein